MPVLSSNPHVEYLGDGKVVADFRSLQGAIKFYLCPLQIWNNQLTCKYGTIDNSARWRFVQTYGWCLISIVASIKVIGPDIIYTYHEGNDLAGINKGNFQLFLGPLKAQETLKPVD